jgi:hypothetical protein
MTTSRDDDDDNDDNDEIVEVHQYAIKNHNGRSKNESILIYLDITFPMLPHTLCMDVPNR